MYFENDIWIFAYGSLMWRPGFDYLEAQDAHLNGYHRDMCVLSYVFRGTRDVPGLVMGLKPDGDCVGRAFKVAASDGKDVMAYLHEREMINNVYEPTWVNVTLKDGRQVPAYTFVALQDHPQYVGQVCVEEKVAFVLQGRGQSGTALEYLENTCCHIRELGIEDAELEDILCRARAKKSP